MVKSSARWSRLKTSRTTSASISTVTDRSTVPLPELKDSHGAGTQAAIRPARPRRINEEKAAVAKRIDQIGVNVPVIMQTVGGTCAARARARRDDRRRRQPESRTSAAGSRIWSLRGDCRVFVPPEMKKVVYHVGGDARIADLEGNVGSKHRRRSTAGRRACDRSAPWAAAAPLGRGRRHHQNVGGDAALREIAGTCTSERRRRPFLQAIERLHRRQCGRRPGDEHCVPRRTQYRLTQAVISYAASSPARARSSGCRLM